MPVLSQLYHLLGPAAHDDHLTRDLRWCLAAETIQQKEQFWIKPPIGLRKNAHFFSTTCFFQMINGQRAMCWKSAIFKANRVASPSDEPLFGCPESWLETIAAGQTSCCTATMAEREAIGTCLPYGCVWRLGCSIWQTDSLQWKIAKCSRYIHCKMSHVQCVCLTSPFVAISD